MGRQIRGGGGICFQGPCLAAWLPWNRWFPGWGGHSAPDRREALRPGSAWEANVVPGNQGRCCGYTCSQGGFFFHCSGSLGEADSDRRVWSGQGGAWEGVRRLQVLWDLRTTCVSRPERPHTPAPSPCAAVLHGASVGGAPAMCWGPEQEWQVHRRASCWRQWLSAPSV